MMKNRVSFSFPQVYKALFIFITILSTVATVGRPFSKLKLIKRYPLILPFSYLLQFEIVFLPLLILQVIRLQ